jgi:DNA/RNA endonuclease G (NUC1)
MSPIRQKFGLFVGGIFFGSSLGYFVGRFWERRNEEAIVRLEGLSKLGYPTNPFDLIVRDGYTLAYNRQSRNATWAGEYISKDSSSATNPESKPNRAKAQFKEDPLIPDMFKSRLSDYFHSGYDRGHLVPAADVLTQKDLNDTFYLTNISPQVAQGFNRAYWAWLERFCRTLTKEFDELFIYTGPLFLPKLEDNGKAIVQYELIGNPPNTAVPTHFYKIVLGICKDGHYLASFLLPNEPIDPSIPLESFQVPLDAIERSSGIQFFPLLQRKPKLLCERVKCVVQQFKSFTNKT